MKGDVLPDENHIALHCQPSTFLERNKYGVPTGVNADVFRVDNDGISGNWLEYYPGAQNAQFKSACATFRQVRKVKPSHMVGVMKIGEIADCGRKFGKPVKTEHDPIAPDYMAHSLVVGVAPADKELLQSLTLLVSLRAFSP